MLESLLPIPLSLAGWTDDSVWGVCSASLGTWFIIGNLLYLRGEAMDRSTHRRITVPIITPIFQGMGLVSFVMGVALWLSAFDLGVPRNQAFYVFGLMILLVYVAVEFLFFIGVISQQDRSDGLVARPNDMIGRVTACGRKQPLAFSDIRSGECPVYPETSRSGGSISGITKRLLLTQSGSER
jgi:hypothetical protein